MYGGNGDTGWTISQSGAATFKTIYASNKGTIGGWTINGNKIQGGNVTLNANGNIDCTGGNGWYIHSDGSARFGNLRIDAGGNITANGGNFNNITANGGNFNDVNVSGTVDATSGRFDNCTIGGSCTIGGQRVDGAFVKNANIASGAVTGGKIASNAVTADKINVNSLSAISADLGHITAGSLDLNGNLTINGSFTTSGDLIISSLESASCSMNGNPQAMGGIAVTSFSIRLGTRTVRMSFKQGILTNATKTNRDVYLLDYTSTW